MCMPHQAGGVMFYGIAYIWYPTSLQSVPTALFICDDVTKTAAYSTKLEEFTRIGLLILQLSSDIDMLPKTRCGSSKLPIINPVKNLVRVAQQCPKKHLMEKATQTVDTRLQKETSQPRKESQKRVKEAWKKKNKNHFARTLSSVGAKGADRQRDPSPSWTLVKCKKERIEAERYPANYSKRRHVYTEILRRVKANPAPKELSNAY